MDRRVGHKSGLVLKFKEHIYSDTVCPVQRCLHAHHSINMYCEAYLINLLKQVLNYHPNPVKLNP